MGTKELETIVTVRKVLMELTATDKASELHTCTDIASMEVVTLVKKLAKEWHSTTLAKLVSNISAVIKYNSAAGLLIRIRD